MKKNPLNNISRVLCLITFCGMTAPLSYATHSWGTYHWARQTPQFTLMLGNNHTNTHSYCCR